MSRPPAGGETPSGGGGKLGTLARAAATMGGAGYFPVAPGTAGSVVGAALYWALYQGGSRLPVAAFFLIAAMAIWSAGAVERETGIKDPPEVVADEAAGQILCLLGAVPTAVNLAAGLAVFRLFDIWKPFRRIERLPGGWGVVADDLLAGAAGWVVLALGRGMGYL